MNSVERLRYLVVVLVAALSIAACGGGAGDSFVPDGMYETQREAVSVQGAGICQYSQRCADPAWPKSYIPACIQSHVDDTCMVFDCEAQPVATDAEVDACFYALEALQCDEPVAFDMACDKILDDSLRLPGQ